LSPRKKISRPKVKKFVEDCLRLGITSPSEMKSRYEKQWKKSFSNEAFINATRRLGVSSEQRKQIAEQAQKQTVCKDISEYRQYQAFETTRIRLTKEQKDKQLKYIRRLWEIMGCTNPEEWTYEDLLKKLKTIYPTKIDERGREVFEHPGAIRTLLSAVNTIFPGILPEGYSGDYSRKPGELKDHFSFSEYDEFKRNLQPSPSMSREGWVAAFDGQTNMGSREGSRGITGILSLKWEDINYSTRRCSLREKGGRGDSARLWKNLPLDFFPWLHGWESLMTWHLEKFGYTPTNEKHETGVVFPVGYHTYCDAFHGARRRCNSRISEDLETMRPHILRKTHAQWCKKLRIPLEQICGDFPNGRNGVGWDNPKILLDFYVEVEEDEYEETDKKATERMVKLGLVSPPPLSTVAPIPMVTT
jgi:integrase